MNTNYNNVNFSSTFIPTKQNAGLVNVINSVAPYFEVQGFGHMQPSKIRNKINLGQAGLGISKDEIVLVGKDREADEFISRMIKKNNIESKYVQDTPETKFDEPVIDLTI